MAKRVLCGDIHGGVKDGNEVVMNYQINFLNWMIKYCIENAINNIKQLGDCWEVRRATNNNVSDRWKKEFYNIMEEAGIDFDTLVGNHDAYFKNKIKPNFTETLLSKYSNVNIYQDPTEVMVDGIKWLMVPWICKENYDECINMLETTDARVVCGHFEIKGARMESGVCEDGIPMEFFKRFDLVLSGHFHSQGVYGNIRYIGTPYDTSWSEYGDPKGFWVIDTETLELEFVRNDNPLHVKITYVEENNMDEILAEDLTNKFVKVTIESRENFKKYEKWLMALEAKGMFDLKIIEPLMTLDNTESDAEVDVDILNVSKTEELIVEYANDVYPEKADRVAKMMLGFHSEARNMTCS